MFSTEAISYKYTFTLVALLKTPKNPQHDWRHDDVFFEGQYLS